LVAERTAPAEEGDVPAGTPFWQLREALRSDGLDLVAEYETTEEMWGRSRSRLLGARLLPLDGPRAPLSDEITALEHEFDRLGLTVARNCYRQAVDHLVEQRFEAANGQLRAMFEAVAVKASTVSLAPGTQSCYPLGSPRQGGVPRNQPLSVPVRLCWPWSKTLLGVTPNACLKAVLKWPMLLKPQRKATSVTVVPPCARERSR
jgi:hypothetical protein